MTMNGGEDITLQKILKNETMVLKCVGYSLSHHQIITPFDFYYRYFQVVGGPEKCKYFGSFLLHLIMMYPKSLYKFGPNLLGASALYLVLKICDEYTFSWNEKLAEMTGFQKEELNQSSKKICKKYIDLVFNETKSKEDRLLIIKYKYGTSKYFEASKIKPLIN